MSAACGCVQDEDDEDHDHEMDYMRKTAADAETVFYNSDMDDDAPPLGTSFGTSADMMVCGCVCLCVCQKVLTVYAPLRHSRPPPLHRSKPF